MFTVDGTPYNVSIIEMKRNFASLDRGDTGRSTTTGAMIRNVLGSFYTYDIVLDTKQLDTSQYDSLYEVLTSPDDFHNFIFPYGQTNYDFVGYIAAAQDTLKRIQGTKRLWGNLSFTAVAKYAKRRP